MINKTYTLRYLPLFEKDLIEITNYIKNVLQNESAALKLVDDVIMFLLRKWGVCIYENRIWTWRWY